MILADCDIEFQQRLGTISIEPYSPDLLQPASYDLTLGPYATFIDQPNGPWVEKFDGPGLHYYLNPDQFVLLSTVERVTLGASHAGQVAGKSTLARKGLIIESAGFVDPGFSGQLTLEVKNIGPNPIVLTAGMPIAQIVFFQMTRPASNPYSAERNHYQGQTGPTPARN